MAPISMEDDEILDREEDSLNQVLVNVSFKVEAGTTVAFVGPSGAGKSTVVNLMVRGWDPDEGQIIVDGHDLRLLDLEQFRRAIGLVEQNVILFDNSLRYNILFGLNGAGDMITDTEMEKIAREACVDRFQHRLPMGWETLIGQNGLKLSGGERQRVGIARALIKQPAILILDEATSSLDTVNESLIQEAFHNASSGRTTIIIAHRLSTVRHADKIFVMDKGSVIAEGCHEELLLSSEMYRELVTKQLVAV